MRKLAAVFFCLLVVHHIPCAAHNKDVHRMAPPFCGYKLTDPRFCFGLSYDRLVPPTLPVGEKLPLNITLHIEGIEEVDEAALTMTASVLVKMHWLDRRIKIGPASHWGGNHSMVLDLNLVNHMWIPGLRFRRSVAFRPQGVLNSMSTSEIFLDGSTSLAFWTTVTVNCDFDFHLYPLDHQACDLQIDLFPAIPAVALRGDFSYVRSVQKTIGWTFGVRETEECNLPPGGGNGSAAACYPTAVTMQRLRKGYYLRSFFPATLMVIVSWVQFFIEQRNIAIRLLIISNLAYAEVKILNRVSAPTSHITALDSYILCCLGFISLSYVEYGYVLYKRSPKPLPNAPKEIQPQSPHERLKRLLSGRPRKTRRLRRATGSLMAVARIFAPAMDTDNIDIAALMLFPASFMAFLGGYWWYVLNYYR